MKRGKRVGAELPLKGFAAGESYRFIDSLSDDQLEEVNRALNWNCFVVDGRGRRFGDFYSPGKRDVPQPLPDRKITLFHERVGLSSKHVLEIGCFEGVHTVALCRLAGRVTAIDSRVEHIIKTLVRVGFADLSARVFCCNVEEGPYPYDLLASDCCFHSGVLYHLADPVKHLERLSESLSDAMLLDTHVAPRGVLLETYECSGRTYKYWTYREDDLRAPFAGMSPSAKWLTRESLFSALAQVGFRRVEILSESIQRNGPRVALIARK